MKERECSAPVHAETCPCVGCKRNSCRGCDVPTKDHITPRSIVKEYRRHGVSMQNPNRKENLQWLSWECHQEKDLSTERRLRFLRSTLNGRNKDLDNYKDRILTLEARKETACK